MTQYLGFLGIIKMLTIRKDFGTMLVKPKLLTCTKIYWLILTITGMFWHILACTDIYWHYWNALISRTRELLLRYPFQWKIICSSLILSCDISWNKQIIQRPLMWWRELLKLEITPSFDVFIGRLVSSRSVSVGNYGNTNKQMPRGSVQLSRANFSGDSLVSLIKSF